MSYYRLSHRSNERLNNVEPDLVRVVKRAIELTRVDFGVIQGLRTLDEQKKLYAYGASRTMKSKHLSGRAVDLLAYIGSRGSWEINLYDDIADAMKRAAITEGVGIRWGAAWNIPDLTDWMGTCEEAMAHYIDTRRSQKRRPFIDGPHFELIDDHVYHGA
jgi:peptidoglycan L-alanyl-D-glutamate endopeptidase CwlK